MSRAACCKDSLQGENHAQTLTVRKSLTSLELCERPPGRPHLDTEELAARSRTTVGTFGPLLPSDDELGRGKQPYHSQHKHGTVQSPESHIGTFTSRRWRCKSDDKSENCSSPFRLRPWTSNNIGDGSAPRAYFPFSRGDGMAENDECNIISSSGGVAHGQTSVEYT